MICSIEMMNRTAICEMRKVLLDRGVTCNKRSVPFFLISINGTEVPKSPVESKAKISIPGNINSTNERPDWDFGIT